MYHYMSCKKINDFMYDLRIDTSEINSIIKKHNLHYRGDFKEYNINDIQIISDKQKLTFLKIHQEDISYNEEKEYLQCTILKESIESFSFYNTDEEKSYKLYESNQKDISILIKVFKDYCLFEYITDIKNKYLQLK